MSEMALQISGMCSNTMIFKGLALVRADAGKESSVTKGYLKYEKSV